MQYDKLLLKKFRSVMKSVHQVPTFVEISLGCNAQINGCNAWWAAVMRSGKDKKIQEWETK